MATTLGSIRLYIREQLSANFDREETASLSRLLIGHYFNLNGPAALVAEYLPLDEAVAKETLHQPIQRLLNNEPIQHIVEWVDFLDIKLKVSPVVLIPRPETEELVQLITKNYKGRKINRLVDFCTGSGCIAISLAKSLEVTEVLAYDISKEAIALAKENIIANKADIKLYQEDILKNDFTLNGSVDLIVSNPPYVLELEKIQMHKNVLEYEPHLALFVPDNDPLLFYRRLRDLAKHHLSVGGEIWLEVNERYGNETAALFSQDFKDASVIEDFRGKPRFVKARKK